MGVQSEENPDGSVSRYKARLVAQGFSQEHVIDFLELLLLFEAYHYEDNSSLNCH